MNPYASLPDSAFWSKSVSSGDWLKSLDSVPPYLLQGDHVMSMGSCFAANLVPYLEAANIHYVRTEKFPAFVRAHDSRFNYDIFSAAYGNIYTARAMLQLVQRVNGRFVRSLGPWKSERGCIDPLRPGLPFPAETISEYRALIESHLNCTRRAIQQSSVFVLTLGLIEAWRDRGSGAILPAAPGTIAGEFSASEHELVVFTVDEVIEDLVGLRKEILEIKPSIRFLVTVSPIPLVATATSENVVIANSHSKSVLRTAAARLVQDFADCRYVPSYEILIGAQVRRSFFESDCRTVEVEGISRVMGHFLRGLDEPKQPNNPEVKTLADRECEEVLQAKTKRG